MEIIELMKSYIYVLFLMISTVLVAQTTNPNYDAELAKKLGADDYGMKPYVLVILTTGSNTDSDEKIKAKAFEGHMSNMETMVKQNKLVVAGPIESNEDAYRGLFILNAQSLEEARAILETDPAIKANYLEPKMYLWYGSAALPEYLEASDKIWKKGI